MFPGSSFEEILTAYSIAGGTPLYLNKFIGKTWQHAVGETIFRKGEPLYEEVEFLLREEFKEPRNYFVILEALSLGKHKLSELINETGFDKSTLSRYISILNDLHITRKEIPITEKFPEKSRKGLYFINDNFFDFWFRFVFRNRALLEENRIEEVLARVSAGIPQMLSKNYENAARDIIKTEIARNNLPFEFDSYGRWWDNNNEIDLVAVNMSNDEILFAEVKWTNKPVGTNIFANLKKKSSFVDWGTGKRKEHFALFSKSGFTDEMEKLAKKENILLIKEDRLLAP
jgi:hypothetical protein